LDLRHHFEKDGIFPAGVIDALAAKLKSFNDRGISEELYGNNEAIAKLVKEYLHCG
jgi:glutamine synthetase